MEGTKTCRRCNETKPLTEMKRDTRNGDGYSSFCKECHKAATIAWQKANPERVNATRRKRYEVRKDSINERRKQQYDYSKVRWDRIRYLYKTTRDWYETKLEEQDFKCAICGRSAHELTRQLSVDHDHSCCLKTPTCGKCNRGLLCHFCNTSLHSIERDKSWLSSAVKYLGGGEIK